MYDVAVAEIGCNNVNEDREEMAVSALVGDIRVALLADSMAPPGGVDKPVPNVGS